jgi:hypothetical protein
MTSPTYGARHLPVLTERRTDFEACVDCGRCCKSYPGLYVPEDFGGDLERMVNAVRKGVAQMDRWDGEGDELGTVYFLRAPELHAEELDYYESWGGPCALLRDDGCSLAYEQRPRNCRGVAPNQTANCAENAGPDGDFARIEKRDYVVTWKPFSDALETAVWAIDEVAE